MLGEIRDPDTAQMAIQAALSGTAVFSTFHTFDAPSLISRLTEMGLTQSVIAQAIKGVISARLVRTICIGCKTPYQLTEQEKKLWGNNPIGTTFMKGYGCDQCAHTGFRGRTGIFEIIYFDQDFQANIIEKKPASTLYELIKNKKVSSLRESGYVKVAKGETTIAEINRIVGFPME